jgi:diaminohydroxyphosphoribosylaminopyrimidine deaminase/5-amino-6-(5-phosphoribosylamino)uracil reductase
MRTDEAAIIVGTNTAEKDNPSLTVRDWNGCHPLRIVIDRNLRLPKSLALFDQSAPTLVFTSKKAESSFNLEYATVDFNGDEIDQMLDYLYQHGIISLIVEGGRTLLNSFIEKYLWDEARVFTGKKFFVRGIPSPKIDCFPVKAESLDDSSVLVYRNENRISQNGL